MGKFSDAEQVKQMMRERRRNERKLFLELQNQACPLCGKPLIRATLNNQMPKIYFGELTCARCIKDIIDLKYAHDSTLGKK